MQYVIRIAVSIIIFFINLTNVHARWANIEDVQTEVKFYNQEIKIKPDATYEAIVETKAQILKEGGRFEAANYKLYYDGSNSRITILEAKTIYEGKEYVVDQNMIEDKPLASNKQGFDDYRQISIAFPRAEIGAEIYLKYAEKVTDAIPVGFFGERLFYGITGCWQNSRVSIESELPLHVKANDPDGVLSVKQTKEGKIDKIELELMQPICRTIVNEPPYGVVNKKHLPFVTISSLVDWKDLAKRIAPDYEKVIYQPLPRVFEDILEKAAKAKEPVDKINIVVSSLNEKISYMGDWRSINSKLAPKNLEQIAASQTGDCKDFTVSTASILKAMGFKVQVAAVMRGGGVLPLYDELPIAGEFNHVFLKVTDPDSQVYWIDPTNPVSMAQGIFGDVADRMVMILDSNNPSYEKSPAVDPKYSESILVDQLEIIDDKVFHEGYWTHKGNRAINFAVSKLYNSEENIKDGMFNLLARRFLEDKYKQELILPQVKSRIVEDVTFKFKYRDDQIIKTNFLPAIHIPCPWIEEIINDIPDQVGDLWMDSPITVTRINVIKNQKIKGIENLNYETDTPWVSVKRTGKYTGNSTEIKDVIVFKKEFISNEELRSSEYKDLKRNLIENFKNTIILLNNPVENAERK